MSGSQQLLLGGKKAAEAVYIEDIFSTYLYTGNGSTQTITNGIDLLGKGGLVWQKARSSNANHLLTDTVRGSGYSLNSNSTLGQFYNASIVSSFNSNGFTDGASQVNGVTYASWTFRKQPKFFDVVTYTGDGTTSRTIGHNLQSSPGFYVVKRTDSTGNWLAASRAQELTQGGNPNSTAGTLKLNSSAAAGGWTGGAYDVWAYGSSSTWFVVSNLANINGATYVAYLFAHNAGGFGLTGTDNVISCGSFTTAADGSASVTLGYEPQWILVKKTNGAEDWTLVDSMRGMPVDGAVGGDKVLFPNLSSLEQNHAYFDPSATGFSIPAGWWLSTSSTYIYIAIRRGPMKTPTDATKVFQSVARTGTESAELILTSFPPDLVVTRKRSAGSPVWHDRLRGAQNRLRSSETSAEVVDSAGVTSFGSNGVVVGADNIYGDVNSIANFINWFFRRAPGFFDEICYSATTSGAFRQHGLGVAPELIIDKRRDGTGTNQDWYVWHKDFGNTYSILLNSNAARNSSFPFITDVSSTQYASETQVASTRVAYLFASCPGVSKVGSYTGTGTTQTINCDFTGGARFVLIKAISTTGNWLVWDSARGIVAGNDPYLLLDSTAGEVTTTDWVDTAATGFELSNTGGNLANSNGVSYIFLAIA